MEEKQTWRQRMRWRWLWLCRRERSGTIVIILMLVLAAVMLNLVLQVRADRQTVAMQRAQIQELTRERNRLGEDGIRIDRMEEFYGEVGDAPWCSTDEEFWERCQRQYPGAVYPSTEWTAETIVQSYYDMPEIWVYHDLGQLMGVYLTWTTDGHCFVLDVEQPALNREHPEIVSGWLVIDGVRAKYLDKETYGVNSGMAYWDLFIDYRKGEWDGSIRRSPDGTTTVWVGMNGNLEWRYEAWFYDETTDPDGLAWAGFSRATVPWWRSETDCTMKDLVRPQLENLREWDANKSHVYESLSTKIYIGASTLTDGAKVTQTLWAKDEGELFTLEPAIIRMYRDGEELEQWVCTGTTASGVKLLAARDEASTEFAEDLAYFYDGKTLRALRANGEMITVMDEILVKPGTIERDIWGLKNGRLTHYGKQGLEILAEDVLETDFSRLLLFRKAEGWYVMSKGSAGWSGDYEAVYWGTGEKEDYLEAYEILRWSAR